MISLEQPTPEALRRLAEQLGDNAITSPTDLLADRPRWWFDDQHRARIGGPDDFDTACTALRDWAMFDQGWTVAVSPPVAIEPETTVSYSAKVIGVWWSYGCRIINVIDEPDRLGFVYATVGPHAECGEELFEVRRDDDGTWFALHAISRPGRWFAWPGLPIARLAQRRFRSGASAAMRAAVTRAAHPR